jgi:hypothetical protein
MDWLMALLETVFHLDALTMGKLALTDDILRRHAFNAAAGLVHRNAPVPEDVAT